MTIQFKKMALGIALLSSFSATVAQAAWAPTKPIEFIASAGPGGGTDQFARIVQSIVQKYNLTPTSIVVSNKGGGAGTEAFVYGEGIKGDAHKLIFSTNLAWLMPMITKVGYKIEDMTPVATMAADEFVLWTSASAPYKTTQELLAAAKEKKGAFKMGGAQSKDTDHILTRKIEEVAGLNVTYIPFKSGGEAAVQLAGGHLDSNTNNPGENASYWKAGKVRPLCVFSSSPLSGTDKVSKDMSWSDIPLCKDNGIAIDAFNMPRTVWMAGGVTAEETAYYVDMLKKVAEKPEWKAWLARGVQSEFFQDGAQLNAYIKKDVSEHRDLFEKNGWLVNN
ncbi:tripartite tricarboxylate transporter substrate binding protein [Candidimonas sp. SYP-B2681]|uniref:Bug family tripartite tricarboxylate transporter substrate binding protein n=1 Tax=Candidimonas sp. SYP-B2681 TaxID=2497686 RepID=UPI000F873798|nr:tripartite tricarboxylate transporter substrate-binding protein [Candidimonas sp. SYP-B2681]RTZ41636.1 tripartite tricarboxylate transporter substrate binding protein [Candidimonas sp. SYP-B2681]